MNEEAKKAFKRFAMRLRRAFPAVSAVWRMEPQERGAAHFHLLVFNLPFWKQCDLQMVWEACTGEKRSIVHIKLVHGARSVMAYVSKYIAKEDARDELTSLDDDAYQHAPREKLAGRFWGWIRKECLPLGQKLEGILTDRQTIRSLSSFVWSLLGEGNPYASISCHLFCDNAQWLCERAVEEGGCWLDEWEYTTHDHTAPKSEAHPYTLHFSTADLETNTGLILGRMARPNEVSLYQPCIRSWLNPRYKSDRQEMNLPYFDKYRKVVISDVY